MLVRVLVLTAMLVAGPVAAQTRSQNPATTPSSAGAGDNHTPSSQIQDPTLGSGQSKATTGKVHHAKPKHAKPTRTSPGMS